MARFLAGGTADAAPACDIVDTGHVRARDLAIEVPSSPLETVPDRQTSHKAGSRSIAQKEDAAKYPDRSMPPTHKVAGAFGKEPKDEPSE